MEAAAMRPLPVLRELTDLLPTDAWLTTLSFDQKGVELTGQAAAASALIPILENSPRLERVEFASPVTRGREKEQFRIRAAWELAPVATAPTAATGPATPAAGGRPAGGRQAPGQPPALDVRQAPGQRPAAPAAQAPVPPQPVQAAPGQPPAAPQPGALQPVPQPAQTPPAVLQPEQP